MPRGIGFVLTGLAAGALLAVLPAAAATLLGTDRGETIRGTPAADRILGRGGNDVLIGGAGRDVVDGGRGADRLSLRDGVRDTAICGLGKDLVLADPADVVLGDCETLRIVPPEPPAPPPRPVVAGVYGGRTTQGELVTFEVTSGGELSELVFPAIGLSCSPGDQQLTWAHDFGAKTSVIQRDGRFSMTDSGVREVAGGSATYTIAVSGLLTVGISTGTVDVSVQAAGSTCAAPGLRWTAAAATLTGP